MSTLSSMLASFKELSSKLRGTDWSEGGGGGREKALETRVDQRISEALVEGPSREALAARR